MFYQGKPASDSAASYDAHIAKTIPYYHSFHSEIINFVSSLRCEPRLWLDTGCGTGTLVLNALKSFPHTEFLLADPSVDMLELARRKLTPASGSRVTFLEGIATQEIDLGQGVSPDVITAVQCHHYLDKQAREQATKKCYDILKNSGIYITFENIRPLTEVGEELGKSYWRDFQIASGKADEEANRHINRFDVEYFPITVEEHITLMRGCGFQVVEIFWYSYMQAGFYGVK